MPDHAVKSSPRMVVSTNRRAMADYFILERFEAGIALAGSEVKSLRAREVSFKDAYAEILGGELWLRNLHISPYAQAGRYAPDPIRPRKLLLHRTEIVRLLGKVQQKGLTLIPLAVYFTRGIAKVKLGLAKGKAAYDKRRAISEREARRDVERALRERQKA
jgi:SsrA-binding protein